MRGPLWRGWHWTPRIWWSRFFRRLAVWFEGRQEREQRARAAALPTRARRWPWPLLSTVLVVGAGVIFSVMVLTQLVVPAVQLVFGHLFERTPTGWRWTNPFFNPCAGGAGEHCGTLIAFLTPLASLALGGVVFHVITRGPVRWYRKVALERPYALVQTANETLDEVVGRQELCEVLSERIRDPDVRCPIVVVGGVGVGKTASLVALTRELARRRITPVPIRLHDVQAGETLNFEELARTRFLQVVNARLWHDADGGRLWRQLRQRNRIAVLADGLEETVKGEKDKSGESVLRAAIAQAAEDGLPLVIASRPYDPLRGMSAIIVGLEPLGEGAALEYALFDDRTPTESAWSPVVHLVNAADVTESPMFLRIIRDLGRHGQLPQGLSEPPEPGTLARPDDRYAVRWELLKAWKEALLEGYVCEDFARSRADRQHSLDVLSAFACVGFLRNSPQVTYADLTDKSRWADRNSETHGILRLLQRRLGGRLDPEELANLTHATTEGGVLGIVDAQQDGVRFQHGVIQGYLGAEFLADRQLRMQLLREIITSRPSREMLIALTLLSRRLAAERPRQVGVVRATLAPAVDPVADLVARLRRQASGERNHCWRLELYAAAVEIDTSARRPEHAELVGKIEAQWGEVQEKDAPDRPTDEAKLQLIRRLGDAARLITDRRRHPRPGQRLRRPPPYASIFRIACREASYRIRFAAAREIGLGGRDSVRSLRELDGVGPRRLDLDSGADPDADRRARREQQLRGWIAPLLFLSTVRDEERDRSDEPVRQQHTDLQAWLEALARYDPARPDARVEITSEMALAQGFRLAANMRRLPVGRQSFERSFLVEMAEQALRRSRYWYSQLVLVQALTLLSLPKDPSEALPAQGHGANPYGIVQHWLRIAGEDVPAREPCAAHPFLTEVGRLCVLTLLTRRPERYCWVDEGETASRVGSASATAVIRREQRLWIPDSMGWSLLALRAQRLLGDVMLLLNLADRGDLLADREQRLRRADRCDLPPCLTNDRRALEPARSLHTAERCEPGATCLDDCPFRLCPLPAKGERLPHQMDQNFCAHQADLATFGFSLRGPAPWQSIPRANLRLFWRRMSERNLPHWRQ